MSRGRLAVQVIVAVEFLAAAGTRVEPERFHLANDARADRVRDRVESAVRGGRHLDAVDPAGLEAKPCLHLRQWDEAALAQRGARVFNVPSFFERFEQLQVVGRDDGRNGFPAAGERYALAIAGDAVNRVTQLVARLGHADCLRHGLHLRTSGTKAQRTSSFLRAFRQQLRIARPLEHPSTAFPDLRVHRIGRQVEIAGPLDLAVFGWLSRTARN